MFKLETKAQAMPMTYPTLNSQTQAFVPAHSKIPQTSEVFDTFVLELITPSGKIETPSLTGWQLMAWPVARLGDLTLEAKALYSYLRTEDLATDLAKAGYKVLGPIHQRKGNQRKGHQHRG